MNRFVSIANALLVVSSLWYEFSIPQQLILWLVCLVIFFYALGCCIAVQFLCYGAKSNFYFTKYRKYGRLNNVNIDCMFLRSSVGRADGC